MREEQSSQGAVGPGEAARRLGVSPRTVQRWLREGRLPAVRIGSRLKVDPAAFASGGRSQGRTTRPIRRLLVANRGELVVRIARTCRDLGITCLALVTEDQVAAWWGHQADEVVPLATGYLDGSAVLDAARGARADAIHPGYGFLAESAEFAEAVDASGITWIGPPPSAMRALGDKAAGRTLAASAGVPILPGYDGPRQDDETLSYEAQRLGYPVLVKPSAGGGGKGMHVLHGPDALTETLARARREASGAFGDERLILERIVARPRHVEIQFLIDSHGDGIHLGERDCSLQRRHQKVIEESPSPAVDSELRARLGDWSLRLARAAGYVGAGTAEYLLDEGGDAFFLEVNARLQVEHPVTELVTGRDLVADQLRIAAGEALAVSQRDVALEGHAIEARLYAEDPWADFLPADGEMRAVRWSAMPGVRIDAGVGSGDTVGTRYDPLLAKLIAHGSDRDEALQRLRAALDDTSVLGVTTNRGFLHALLDSMEFRSGGARTDTIERIWPPPEDPRLTTRIFRAAAAALSSRPTGSAVPRGFRLNAPATLRVGLGREERAIAPDREALSEMRWAWDGVTVHLDVDGRAFEARLAAGPTVESAVSHAQREHRGRSSVVAPMPGQVLAVRVAEADTVEAGQTLILLEAMKMENAVTAPASGIVARVAVDVGAQVQRGDVLVELA